MKHDQFWKEVHEPETQSWQGKPHGWLQWKGTGACIDLHCVCGSHGHLDEEFLYFYRCAKCGRKYALDGHVKLVELNEEQAKYVEEATLGYKTDESVAEEDSET